MIKQTTDDSKMTEVFVCVCTVLQNTKNCRTKNYQEHNIAPMELILSVKLLANLYLICKQKINNIVNILR